MKGRSPEIKPPKFLVDLYRDLRDQRLLPLVILLLIAIPAVPIILSDPTPAFVAPPADEGLAATVADDSLMVVSAPAGLRRYGDRLADRKPRDPFVNPDAQASGTAEDGSDTAAGGGGSAAGSEPIAPEPTPPDDGTGSSGTTGSDGGGSTGSGDDGGGTSVPPAQPPDPVEPADPSLTFYRLKTDVRFGKAGSGLVRPFEDVDRMRGFPAKSPIAVFIGASEDGERAVFSISADAALVKGDGQCSSGRPKDCQFLTLRPGNAVNIRDARRGVVWRLGVTSIEVVETEFDPAKHRPGTTGTGDGEGSGGGTGAEPLSPEPVETASLSEVIGLYLLK